MPSASTLIRRAKAAEKKGHRNAAKRLREEAAKLRRAERAAPAKKKAKKKANKIIAGLEQALAHAMDVPQQERGPLDDAVDRVLGPKATADQRIAMRRELIEARKTGENNAAAKHGGTVQMLTEGHNISMVSSLISIVEHAERLNGNLPPTMVLSGYMVARVVDALKKAGYTINGLNGSGTNRDAIAARVSDSRRQWRLASPNEKAGVFGATH